MEKHFVTTYDADSGRGTGQEKVFIYLIESPEELFTRESNPIIDALRKEHMDSSIGLYVYRFKSPEINAFTKIGEVSRIEGIEKRFQRGWHGTKKYSDTYLNKGLHRDVLQVSPSNPMYFIYYEFKSDNSFPKIDEIYVFGEHRNFFGVGTTNSEVVNKNLNVGSNLRWHKGIFQEVLNRRFANESVYPF